jgi:predicted XRE-type DNA-binding protein
MINDPVEVEEGYFVSSDNPFVDDGRPDPEGRMIQAELLCYIVLELKRRGIPRDQMAALLGITRLQVRYLLEVRMSKFSLESLLAMMIRLGAYVITFSQPTEDEPGHIMIRVPQAA